MVVEEISSKGRVMKNVPYLGYSLFSRGGSRDFKLPLDVNVDNEVQRIRQGENMIDLLRRFELSSDVMDQISNSEFNSIWLRIQDEVYDPSSNKMKASHPKAKYDFIPESHLIGIDIIGRYVSDLEALQREDPRKKPNGSLEFEGQQEVMPEELKRFYGPGSTPISSTVSDYLRINHLESYLNPECQSAGYAVYCQYNDYVKVIIPLNEWAEDINNYSPLSEEQLRVN